jgi:hypothetical protein
VTTGLPRLRESRPQVSLIVRARCPAEMHGSSGGPCCPGPGAPGGPGPRWLEARPPPWRQRRTGPVHLPERPVDSEDVPLPVAEQAERLTLAALARLVGINPAESAQGLLARSVDPSKTTPRSFGSVATWTTPCAEFNAPSILGAMVVGGGFESVAVATRDATRPRPPARLLRFVALLPPIAARTVAYDGGQHAGGEELVRRDPRRHVPGVGDDLVAAGDVEGEGVITVDLAGVAPEGEGG